MLDPLFTDGAFADPGSCDPAFDGRALDRDPVDLDAATVDWAGHVPTAGIGPRPGRDLAVPAPRRPTDLEPFADGAGYPPLVRLALARAKVRLAAALDIVSFTAACPACGQDCEWTQERQETKVRSTMNCPCLA